MGGRVGARNEMQACLMQILQRNAEMPRQVTPEELFSGEAAVMWIPSLWINTNRPPNFLLLLNFLIM